MKISSYMVDTMVKGLLTNNEELFDTYPEKLHGEVAKLVEDVAMLSVKHGYDKKGFRWNSEKIDEV